MDGPRGCVAADGAYGRPFAFSGPRGSHHGLSLISTESRFRDLIGRLVRPMHDQLRYSDGRPQWPARLRVRLGQSLRHLRTQHVMRLLRIDRPAGERAGLQVLHVGPELRRTRCRHTAREARRLAARTPTCISSSRGARRLGWTQVTSSMPKATSLALNTRSATPESGSSNRHSTWTSRRSRFSPT